MSKELKLESCLQTKLGSCQGCQHFETILSTARWELVYPFRSSETN